MKAVLVLLLPLLFAAGFSTWGLRVLLRARRSAGWPRVQATVVESAVLRRGGATRRPLIVFQYAVGDRQFRSSRLRVGPPLSTSGSWAEREVARHPPGLRTQAAVDPADPSYGVLEPGVRAEHVLLAVGGATAVLVVLASAVSLVLA